MARRESGPRPDAYIARLAARRRLAASGLEVVQALTIKGNLAITGSAGTAYYGVNAFNGYPGSVVNGNFSYTGNSAPLYISNLTVKGNFNHSGNTSANQIQPGALTVLGNSTIA